MIETLQERLAKAEEELALVNSFVTGQREFVAKWERDGRDCTAAKELLTTYEGLQKVHAEHRDRLLKEAEQPDIAQSVPAM
jgi:hypothetical protein